MNAVDSRLEVSAGHDIIYSTRYWHTTRRYTIEGKLPTMCGRTFGRVRYQHTKQSFDLHLNDAWFFLRYFHFQTPHHNKIRTRPQSPKHLRLHPRRFARTFCDLVHDLVHGCGGWSLPRTDGDTGVVSGPHLSFHGHHLPVAYSHRLLPRERTTPIYRKHLIAGCDIVQSDWT